jgi:hypothetical protein
VHVLQLRDAGGGVMRDAFDDLHAAFMAFARAVSPVAERNEPLSYAIRCATESMESIRRALKKVPNA